MRTLAAILLLSFSLCLHAEEPQWYQVEVIVFENKDAAALGSESWPDDPGTPNTAGSVNLVTRVVPAPGKAPGGAPAATPPPQAYLALAPEQFQLADTRSKLTASGRYAPLLHLAWIQPATGSDTGRPVHVVAGGVDGIITLSRGRVLQVDADLLYRRRAAGPQDPATADKAPKTARLMGARRVRVQELTYLDHPLVGLLVYVAPYGVK